MKPRKFRLHFNRINMQRGKSTVWTVHTSKACYQVEQVRCNVELETVYNPGGNQPRAYLAGRGFIRVVDNIAFIDPVY